MEKILIIDDSRITQALIAYIFADKYELYFQSDGLAGIDAALKILPDLILLDVHMLRMDGYEVCRILKSNNKISEIPVIFITTFDSEAEKVKGFEAGAEDYVIKPFHHKELQARVKAHLAFRKARVQAVELERLKLFREMAVAISHEINNPLTSINAFIYLLQRELVDSSELVRNSMAGIGDEIKRMQKITDRLAQASKVITTNYNRDVSMVDLHNM